MEINVAPERLTFNSSEQEDIVKLMQSIDGNAYLILIDIKAELIKQEMYTMLAQLRDLEETYDCPIMYKYMV